MCLLHVWVLISHLPLPRGGTITRQEGAVLQREDTHTPRAGADGRWGTGALQGKPGMPPQRAGQLLFLQEMPVLCCQCFQYFKEEKNPNLDFSDTYQFSDAVMKLTHRSKDVPSGGALTELQASFTPHRGTGN